MRDLSSWINNYKINYKADTSRLMHFESKKRIKSRQIKLRGVRMAKIDYQQLAFEYNQVLSKEKLTKERLDIGDILWEYNIKNRQSLCMHLKSGGYRRIDGLYKKLTEEEVKNNLNVMKVSNRRSNRNSYNSKFKQNAEKVYDRLKKFPEKVITFEKNDGEILNQLYYLELDKKLNVINDEGRNITIEVIK